jgi:hypothetical protein
VNEKPNVGSPFFETFPSSRIPRATKVVSQCALPHYCKLYQRILGTLQSYYVSNLKTNLCITRLTPAASRSKGAAVSLVCTAQWLDRSVRQLPSIHTNFKRPF